MGAIYHAIWMNIFKASYDLDLKSRVVSVSGETLEISSYLNPINLIWMIILQALCNFNLKMKKNQFQWLHPRNIL